MSAAGSDAAGPETDGAIEVLADGTAHGSPEARTPGADLLDVFGLSMFEPTREKALARFRTYLADTSVTILAHRVAPAAGDRPEGRIDGCIAYRRLGDSLEVLNIGTAPAVRGTGLGRRLIAAALGREGPAGVRLETDSDAEGFYRRCGFSVVSLGEKYPGIERFECRLAGSGLASTRSPPEARVPCPPIPHRETPTLDAMMSPNAT